jgi:hypothetical protein
MWPGRATGPTPSNRGSPQIPFSPKAVVARRIDSNILLKLYAELDSVIMAWSLARHTLWRANPAMNSLGFALFDGAAVLLARGLICQNPGYPP